MSEFLEFLEESLEESKVMTSLNKIKMMVAGIIVTVTLFGLIGGAAYVNADGHGKSVDVEAIKSKIQQALDSGEITQEEFEAKLERLNKGKGFVKTQ